MKNPASSKPRGIVLLREHCLKPLAASAASALLLMGAPGLTVAQSDNFDGDTLSSVWQVRNVCQPLGGYVNNSFPVNGSGKALRLQRGSFNATPLGVEQDYGTGRAWLFQTNGYTDFYVAADVVDWNNGTNQAIVLLGRAKDYDATLAPGYPPGLGTVDGYICNYDNAQDGTLAGDRLGGQFQINRVVNEGPVTLAAADVTLIQGHSYRFILKGQGTNLTAHIYDFWDLTKPLVTLVTGDTNYSSGVSGLVTFHRDGETHPNRTDMTVDNYYANVADPNLDIAPAIRHPMAGTPQVTSRNPANRFTNFHPPASGISFTARSFTANLINAGATKLYLNGTDVSASLVPAPNGSTVNFATVPGTLAANTVYSARIELQDVSGTLTSVNTFWFDTFTDAFVSTAPVKTIEAEDYNFTDASAIPGRYEDDPVQVSGADTNGTLFGGIYFPEGGYFGRQGTRGVDFWDNRTSVEANFSGYRTTDTLTMDYVGITQGGREEILDSTHLSPPDDLVLTRPTDGQRGKYIFYSSDFSMWLNIPEYLVVRTEAGEWMNYTRSFTKTNYLVYLRCGTLGATQARLDRVVGDTTITNQTLTPLGIFDVPNHLMRINYTYEPLTCSGIPVVLPLEGTNTLRLTMLGTPSKDNRLFSLNYLLFVPTSAQPVALLSAATVSGPYSEDTAALIDTASKTITVPATGSARFYRLRQCPPAPAIKSIEVVGGNVVLKY
jgi:hypothetical protein